MATTTIALRRQIANANDRKSVVRTMKASAASAIGQYERSVAALVDDARTVELGLGVCLRSSDLLAAHAPAHARRSSDTMVHAVVFGSDQGLAGRFNEAVVDHAMLHLGVLPAKAQVWAVGERVHAHLLDAGMQPAGSFSVPGSVALITPLVGQSLLKVQRTKASISCDAARANPGRAASPNWLKMLAARTARCGSLLHDAWHWSFKAHAKAQVFSPVNSATGGKGSPRISWPARSAPRNSGRALTGHSRRAVDRSRRVAT